MSRARSFLLPAIVGISTLAHVGAIAALDSEARAKTSQKPLLEFTIAGPPPAPAPPPPPPAASEQPATPRAAPRAPRTPTPTRPVSRTTPPPAPQPVPASAPPPPADFTGTTLTNDSGTGWATAVGTGEPIDGPIGRPGVPRAESARPRVVPAAATTGGPAIVALADLSQPPRAPNLNDALAHNYPATARQRGVAGKAVVRARIGADGKARVLDVVSESLDGFGVACRRTLDGSRWEPPRDRSGQAVDTVLTYTCRFEVGS